MNQEYSLGGGTNVVVATVSEVHLETSNAEKVQNSQR